ncbi:NACHT domain-containing protein [Actinoplanes sp. GCM10030250]|uniref:NACHT domain-containing protein n=1 Tax=Actinoplanes sp. GCM10030250 TaxID=3273376 RepID=UPI00361196C7
MQRLLLVILVVSALTAAAIGLVTNYASEKVPLFFSADPWRVWFVLGLLVQTSIILVLVGTRVSTAPPVGDTGRRPASRAAGRRRLFARDLQRALLKAGAGWNDDHFTELEAEIEVGIKARTRMARLRRPQSVRRVPSLTDALRTSDERLTVLEGEPGSGKSVALRHLALRMAEHAGQRPSEDTELPIYVNLKNFVVPPNAPVSSAHVEQFVLDSLSPRPSRDVDRYLLENFETDRERGRLLFLFDSFDEIPAILAEAEAGPVIDEYVEAIARFVGFGHSRAIVASREFRGPSRTGLPRFRVMPLSRERREQFVQRADLGTPEEQTLLDGMDSMELHLQQLTDNPLFLSLLCEYVRSRRTMPRNSHEVVEDYVLRRLTLDQNRIATRFNVDVTATREFAEEMAFAMLVEPDLGLSADRDRIEERLEHPERTANASIDALIYCGLLRTENDVLVTFSHRRVQEYFATCSVIRGRGNVTRTELLTDGRWRETAVVMLQTQSGTQSAEMLNAIAERLRSSSSAPLWPAGSLYLLDLMASALTPAAIARHPVAEAADNLVERAWSEGGRMDRKWAVELCAATGSDKAVAHLDRAFDSDSMWLRDEAFRQVRRAVPAAAHLEPQIRQMLIDLSADGQLRRERRSLRVQMQRLQATKKLPGYIDLLLAVPIVTIIAFPLGAALMTPFIPAADMPLFWGAGLLGMVSLWLLAWSMRWRTASQSCWERYARRKGWRRSSTKGMPIAVVTALIMLFPVGLLAVVQLLTILTSGVSSLAKIAAMILAAIGLWIGLWPFAALQAVKDGAVLARSRWPLLTATFVADKFFAFWDGVQDFASLFSGILEIPRHFLAWRRRLTLRKVVERASVDSRITRRFTLYLLMLTAATVAVFVPSLGSVGVVAQVVLAFLIFFPDLNESIGSAWLRRRDRQLTAAFFREHRAADVVALQHALARFRTNYGTDIFLTEVHRHEFHRDPETNAFLEFLSIMAEHRQRIAWKQFDAEDRLRPDWLEWWNGHIDGKESPLLALSSETVDGLGQMLEETRREGAFREPV